MTELDIIEKVRACPGIFIGRKSLTGLVHFVGGYLQCLADSGDSIPQETSKAMQEFVREWYGISPQVHWSKILLMMGQSEEDAYDLFFELLDKYHQGFDPKTRERIESPELNRKEESG
jgi:hypothetical protein